MAKKFKKISVGSVSYRIIKADLTNIDKCSGGFLGYLFVWNQIGEKQLEQDVIPITLSVVLIKGPPGELRLTPLAKKAVEIRDGARKAFSQRNGRLPIEKFFGLIDVWPALTRVIWRERTRDDLRSGSRYIDDEAGQLPD
jgi:hypothetical protein